MKKIILAALAIAAMASCNKTEVVGVTESNAIAFDNAFVDNATKSVNDPSFTNSNLFNDFAVYGFVEGAVLFDGTQVSKSITNAELTSLWKYEGTQYWIAGANYNFAAVAPKTDGGWEKETSTVDMTNYTVTTNLSFTNGGTKDLLYADAGKILGKDSGNGTVAFTFRHVLSKVKFSFENAYNASAATIKVYDIKITNAHKTGNVALTSASTEWSGQAGTLVFDFGAAVADDTDTEADAYAYSETLESYNELLLIPGAVTDGYNVTFKVDLLVSDQKIKTYEHTVTANFAPQPGNSYDIKAVINATNIDPEHAQEPIEFTVNELPDWGTANNVDAE